jgi:hypothetical protein
MEAVIIACDVRLLLLPVTCVAEVKKRLKWTENIKRWTEETLTVNTIKSRNRVEWQTFDVETHRTMMLSVETGLIPIYCYIG